METKTILAAIDDYAARSGLTRGTICQYALKNNRFYDRLASGGECLPRTARRLLTWIENNPPSGGSLACGSHNSTTDCASPMVENPTSEAGA
jgi:hypothetical protein